MEGFGIEKLLLVLVIVLVMFGAKRVPEIGASFGKGIREFKRGMSDLTKDDEVAPAARVASRTDDAVEVNRLPEPKRLI